MDVQLDIPVPTPVAEGPQPDLVQGEELKKYLKGMKSEGVSETSIMMRFVNNSPKDIMTVWVDFDGKMKLYSTIKSETSSEQQTFISHSWLLGCSCGPFAGYKPQMTDISNLAYVLITIDENSVVHIEEVSKEVEMTEDKISTEAETEKTDIKPTVEELLTKLHEAKSDKKLFRQLAKEMLKSGDIDSELIKEIIAGKKIKDVIKKPEVVVEMNNEVDEYDTLKVSMLIEMLPEMDIEAVRKLVEINPGMEVNDLLDQLVGMF